MSRFAVSVLAFASFAAFPAPAHHSDAMFDSGKELTLNGTVKEFQYTNPHSWIQLMVPAAGGCAGRVEHRDGGAHCAACAPESGRLRCNRATRSRCAFIR